MAERISMARRIQLRNLAEVEINRYRDNHYLWHKHVHNVELDAMQILKCHEMDESLCTVDFSCRRTGKTAIKELYQLKFNACTPDQREGIVAPREAQAKVNLDYHLDAIRRSEILTAFIDYSRGRRQVADTYYEFANRSGAQCFGIMANVDGGDLTAASLEEVDDMPRDRLYSRFLLMLGSTRRLGASKDSVNNPQIRITGVFKGNDTLQELIDTGTYRSLPIVDKYLALEMGIVQEHVMNEVAKDLSEDDYLRQLLCKNISSRNLIWRKWIRGAMTLGLQAGIQLQEPVPGLRYKKRGLISLGYDHLGHGERPESSKSAVVINEQIGNHVATIYVRTWRPGEDEGVIKKDLVSIWEYFMPDYAIGDAYGIGLITDVNEILFNRGLTTIDRRTIGDGESTASTWPEWAFSPLRFEGMVKHQMAQAARILFNKGHAVLPYFDDLAPAEDDPGTESLRLMMQQLENIKADKLNSGYATYKMVKSKIGDDTFDAYMASLWALITRGMADTPTVVMSSARERDHYLQPGKSLLPGIAA